MTLQTENNQKGRSGYSVTARLVSLLPFYSKARFGWLVLLMFLSAIVEAIGLASILPFLSIMARPELFYDSWIGKFLDEYFHFQNKLNDIYLISIISFAIFALSVVVKGCAHWFQIRTVLRFEADISSGLFDSYLGLDYQTFFKLSPSTRVSNIMSEVGIVVANGFMPLTVIISQFFIIFALLALAIMAGFFNLVVFGSIFGLIFALFGRLLGRKILAYGSDRASAQKGRFELATQALANFKSLFFENSLYNISREFSKRSAQYAHSYSAAHAIGQLPRYAIELSIFGAGYVFIILNLRSGHDLETMLPELGLLAVVGYRLMPSFQRIYQSYSQLRFLAPALDLIDKSLVSSGEKMDVINPSWGEPLSNMDELIRSEGIKFSYGSGQESFAFPTTFSSKKGEITFLIGPSGSGKTTFLDLLLGLLTPSAGRLFWAKSLQNGVKKSKLVGVSYVSQQSMIMPGSIRENICVKEPASPILQRMTADEYLTHCLEVSAASDFVVGLDQGLDTIIREGGHNLSGGQIQRLMLARALYSNPRLLVVDEGTNALDSSSELMVWRNLKAHALEYDMAIIAVTHRGELSQFADAIYQIDPNIRGLDDRS